MTRLPIIVAAALFLLLTSCLVRAQETSSAIEIKTLKNDGGTYVTHDMRNNTATGTNGVFINYNGTVLIADSVFVDENSGQAIADGKVRIQQGEQLWTGEHIRYNFKTHEMISDQFRSGKPPVFMEGQGLHGNIVSNKMEQGTYDSTNGIITTDDVAKPLFKIHASRMRIIPNQHLEAWNAVLYAGDVPVFLLSLLRKKSRPERETILTRFRATAVHSGRSSSAVTIGI